MNSAADNTRETLAKVLELHSPERWRSIMGAVSDACGCDPATPLMSHRAHVADAILASPWLAAHVDAAAAEARGEVEALVHEHRNFTGRLGFGDGLSEPAANLADMVDIIEQAFSEASEYREGPRICEPCGEWLADQPCEHCNGSGCGPGTASGAYSECEWCAGVGKVHPGCVEVSYTDLVSQRDTARADRDRLVEAVRGLVLSYDRAVGALSPATDEDRIAAAAFDALAELRALIAGTDAQGVDGVTG